MNEVLNEYKTKQKHLFTLKNITIFLIAIVFVIVFGIYVGNVLFGERSYIVLKNLQKEKSYLYNDIKRLKKENAELQKIYLERVFLDPDLKKQLK